MKILKELRNSHTPAPTEAVTGIENAKGFPSFYYCRHMEPGLVGYKEERILVDGDAIKRMLPSLNGKPIFLNHQNVELDTMKQKASGYITESFYNELDGWGWAKMMLIDDEAKEAAGSGWAVSNAYVPTNWGGRGLNNNVTYDRAITDGVFTHLALVRDPRYEQAKIFTPDQFKQYQDEKRTQLSALKNSKTENGKVTKMFNLFTRKKEAVTAVDADTMIEITNDKGEKVEMSLSAMVTEVQNAKPAAPAAEVMNAKSKVKVGDEEMTVEDLVSRFNGIKQNSVKVEVAAPAAPAAPVVPATPAAPEPAKPDHFKELANANQAAGAVTTVDTMINRVERGKQRYGSAK